MSALKLCLALVVAPLAGCATVPAPDAAFRDAPLQIEKFLAGRTRAEGVFRNTITGAERKLTATLNGRWNGSTLVLAEDFVFADGARDRKTWRLTKLADGKWSGTREDVIGTATGVQDGKSFRLSYEADLTSQGSATIVRFEDVLTQTAPNVVLNRAVVSKFGVKVGEITLTIRR